MTGALARPPFAGSTLLGEAPGPVPVGDVPAHTEQALVRTFDGVRLATDVYLPSGRRGRVPTILVRLPYDKSGDHAWIPEVAERLVDDGYAVVAQDTRGKARSEGDTRAFAHEAADGAATLDWIEAQPWSDGRVGMFGQSYFGFTQWAAAATGHRALRCIVPQMTATDIGREWMYRQGVFQLQTMAGWAAWAWIEPRMVVHELDWTLLPVASLVERWTGVRSESYSAWVRHGPDASSWRGLLPRGPRFGRVRAAVLSSGGFWDVFQRGQVRDFRLLRRQRSRVPARLWMAARDHFGSEWLPPGAPSPDYDDPALRAEGVERYLGPAPAWYHAWLKTERPPPRDARVTFQVAGEGWRASSTWPPEGSRPLLFHLDRAGGLVAGPPGAGAARAGRIRVIPYWPENPVPTLQDDAWGVLMDPPDREELRARRDVEVFQTAPLERPLVLAGPATVRLEASSHGGARTLHANLVDVWPQGEARRLATGVAMVPRSPGSVAIDLGEVCCRIEPGRALRLELACSDFPRFPRSSGTEDPLRSTILRPGEIRLRLGVATAALKVRVLDP